MKELIRITTTTEKKEDAEAILRKLVEMHLAACGQIVGPISSIYRWKNELVESEEWLCHIKTVRERYTDVEKVIIEMHPYEVPEILVESIVTGSEEYIKWVLSETESGEQSESMEIEGDEDGGHGE